MLLATDWPCFLIAEGQVMRLSLTWQDQDRGIDFIGSVTGHVEGAEFAATSIDVDSFVTWGRAVKGKYGIETKPDSLGDTYDGWCREQLEQCREAIEREAMEKLNRREPVRNRLSG